MLSREVELACRPSIPRNLSHLRSIGGAEAPLYPRPSIGCLGWRLPASTIAVVYWLYSALLLITLVLSAPWWLWQMLRHGKYRSGWSERLGSVPQRLRAHEDVPTIWIHAVSVGEVLAVTQLVAEMKEQLRDHRIIVSTTTDTGQKLARQKFGEENVFRAPLDLPWAVQAFLDALRPRMLVLAESEFWPNLLHQAQEAGVAVAVVNARVSDRSLPRYQRFRWLFTRVLSDVDLLLAQSEEDARRWSRLVLRRSAYMWAAI